MLTQLKGDRTGSVVNGQLLCPVNGRGASRNVNVREGALVPQGTADDCRGMRRFPLESKGEGVAFCGKHIIELGAA